MSYYVKFFPFFFFVLLLTGLSACSSQPSKTSPHQAPIQLTEIAPVTFLLKTENSYSVIKQNSIINALIENLDKHNAYSGLSRVTVNDGCIERQRLPSGGSICVQKNTKLIKFGQKGSEISSSVDEGTINIAFIDPVKKSSIHFSLSLSAEILQDGLTKFTLVPPGAVSIKNGLKPSFGRSTNTDNTPLSSHGEMKGNIVGMLAGLTQDIDTNVFYVPVPVLENGKLYTKMGADNLKRRLQQYGERSPTTSLPLKDNKGGENEDYTINPELVLSGLSLSPQKLSEFKSIQHNEFTLKAKIAALEKGSSVSYQLYTEAKALPNGEIVSSPRKETQVSLLKEILSR